MRRIWLWRALSVVLASSIAVAMTEIGLRSFHEIPEYVIRDEALGWTLRPGVSGWSMDEENNAWVTINGEGLFDREHPVNKPPRTRRIAVLGDSFLATFNLPFEKTFVAFLERRMNDCGGPNAIEAINFGVPGYGTAQELLVYRHRARAYRPDVVVLMMYLGNDILNNHPALNPSGAAPHFVLDHDELRLVPAASDDSPADADVPHPQSEALPLYQQLRLFLTDRLKTATLIYREWARLKSGERPSHWEDPRQDVLYRAPADRDLIDAWQVTEALLNTLAAEVSADGREFWLVTVPASRQADPSAEARRATARQYGVDSLSYADRRIRAYAERNGIRVISLVERLADFSERTGVNLYGGYTPAVPKGFGHWNETGNAVAAQIVSEKLCSRNETW